MSNFASFQKMIWNPNCDVSCYNITEYLRNEFDIINDHVILNINLLGLLGCGQFSVVIKLNHYLTFNIN